MHEVQREKTSALNFVSSLSLSLSRARALGWGGGGAEKEKSGILTSYQPHMTTSGERKKERKDSKTTETKWRNDDADSVNRKMYPTKRNGDADSVNRKMWPTRRNDAGSVNSKM